MNIFNVYNFENPKRKKIVPIEEQLYVLSNLEIAPKYDGYIDWICYSWGKEAIESDPYNLLLFDLGGERENGDSSVVLSDDVYSFDTECVEDDNIYGFILERLSALSKGAFSICNIRSGVDHENQNAYVSFSHNKTNYHWDLEYNYDWFDSDLIQKINLLIKENKSDKFFYTSAPDQNLIVVFSSADVINKLNNLVTVPFIRDTYNID